MNKDEIKLTEFLSKYGTPQNIAIIRDLLSFDLVEPRFGSSLSALLKFQNELMELFPDYIYLKKAINDGKHYWTVLSK